MTSHGDPAAKQDPTHDTATTWSEHATAWTLSTTQTNDNYLPTFLGNGYFGGRIPAAGMGYATEPIETQAHLAGFFAQHGPVERDANIPTWSTLAFSDESGTFGRLPTPGGEQDGRENGSVSHYRQSLDLRAGLLTHTRRGPRRRDTAPISPIRCWSIGRVTGWPRCISPSPHTGAGARASPGSSTAPAPG